MTNYYLSQPKFPTLLPNQCSVVVKCPPLNRILSTDANRRRTTCALHQPGFVGFPVSTNKTLLCSPLAWEIHCPVPLGSVTDVVYRLIQEANVARNKSEEFVRKAASNYTGNYTPNQTSEKDLHQGSLHLPRLSQTNRANHERGLKFTETKGEKTQEQEIRELKIWKWKKPKAARFLHATQRQPSQSKENEPEGKTGRSQSKTAPGFNAAQAAARRPTRPSNGGAWGREAQAREGDWERKQVLTLASRCCGWSSGSASDLGRVLLLRGSGGPWPWRLAAQRTDADRSNAPTAPRCPSTSAAAAANASSSMAMVALAESLPPPPPRPREEVEERRFACGGGDADGQGSDMQETSEPIEPIQGR